MSLEHLRKLGNLVDEEHWDGQSPGSSVRIWRILPAIVVGLAGCAAIALGDGSWLTWTGIVAFLIGLFAFIATNVRAIDAEK